VAVDETHPALANFRKDTAQFIRAGAQARVHAPGIGFQLFLDLAGLLTVAPDQRQPVAQHPLAVLNAARREVKLRMQLLPGRGYLLEGSAQVRLHGLQAAIGLAVQRPPG